MDFKVRVGPRFAKQTDEVPERTKGVTIGELSQRGAW